MIPASLVHQGRKKKQAQYPATHSASPSRVTTLLHPLPSTFPAAFTATPAAPQLRLLPSEPARMQQVPLGLFLDRKLQLQLEE
ncbi:unnamed protein product [Lactuca virosa]|uniref:Uncharacterized protein n=1 Tax=Lactuca virosa TaxID=75947 RepID=A0AAU9NR88_9ASTR|nr:unnamed protein product [Lactuca virosa]